MFDLYDLYDLAYVAGWKPYNDLHDMAHVSWELDLCHTAPAQHPIPAGWDLL